MNETRPLKVCLVALNAYPAIDPQVEGNLGGIETRSWMFARALSKLEGIEVSFVVRHWNALRQPEYDGVKVYLIRDRFYPTRNSLLSRIKKVAHFPWIILKQPRLRDLVDLPIVILLRLLNGKPTPFEPAKPLQAIDADVFVTFGVQSHSATVIASAHSTQRPTVLFLGSENDLDERYLPGNDFVSVYRDQADVCYEILQQADAIFCQTKRQQELLETRFQRQATVIENPIDLVQWDQPIDEPLDEELTGGLSRYVLWVGRADPVHKQPQVLIEIARLCPEIDFLMVMNPRDDLTEHEIKQTAPDNVRIVDRVPFAQMPALYAKAAALINTSSLEGFPNTFLQAAASSVRIASLNVEPNFLNESGAGFYAGGDLRAIANYLRSVWNDTTIHRSGRHYVERHHSLNPQTEKLAEALKEVVEKSRLT